MLRMPLVSANGSRLISHIGVDPGGTYALTPTTQPNPPPLAAATGLAFSGVAPDGSIYVTTAHPAGAVRPQGTPMDTFLVNDAALFETDTGMPIANSGVPAGAMMPIFSPEYVHVPKSEPRAPHESKHRERTPPASHVPWRDRNKRRRKLTSAKSTRQGFTDASLAADGCSVHVRADLT